MTSRKPLSSKPIPHDNAQHSEDVVTVRNIPKQEFASPMDLSFKSILCFQDMLDESKKLTPRNGLVKSKDGKWKCNAVRLNNNGLSDFHGFEDIFSQMLNDFHTLSWLDVSFNELHVIPKAISECTSIKVLYFHGNSIFSIFDVNRLVALDSLISLTLHGNPIESQKGYRQYVLSLLPGLKTLDFSGVTKQDRSTAETWKKLHGKQFRLKRKLSLI